MAGSGATANNYDVKFGNVEDAADRSGRVIVRCRCDVELLDRLGCSMLFSLLLAASLPLAQNLVPDMDSHGEDPLVVRPPPP